eukprot:m.180469 g.180469  ORF g.180469 m.180469 type:complete len:64 (-) comp25420_c0_seq1:96-287(-)
MHSNCRSPTEKFSPFSTTCAARPSGNSSIAFLTCACSLFTCTTKTDRNNNDNTNSHGYTNEGR